MSTGAAKWVLVHVNEWTWLVAQYRVWLIVLITVIGIAAPLMSAARNHVPAAPALVIRSGAIALALSSAAVAICSLLHFSDLRWLAPSQRGSVHVSAPGGIFGFTKPAVGVLNSVADLPVEWRAAQLAVHTAIVCACLALAACVVAVLAWRRARRADIRQVVREEMRKAAGVTSLCRNAAWPRMIVVSRCARVTADYTWPRSSSLLRRRLFYDEECASYTSEKSSRS